LGDGIPSSYKIFILRNFTNAFGLGRILEGRKQQKIDKMFGILVWRSRQDDNIKVYVKDIEWGGGELGLCGQDRDKGWFLVNTLMKL
jgi:hypothetical protein